jgi:hypothetical protein
LRLCDQNPSFRSLKFQEFASRPIQHIGLVGHRFAEAGFFLPPLKVVGSLGVDFDRALNADLVLQFSIGFDDGGVKIPSAIHLDFFEDVDALGRTVAGDDFGHGEDSKSANLALYGYHCGHQAS